MRQQIFRSMIVATVIMITSAALCQDLFITPKWKRDDLRTLYITRTQTLPTLNEAGEPAQLVIPYKASAKVKVYEVTPEVVMISIDHENMVLPMLKPFFETGFPAEIEPFRRMIIRYEVDRGTGSSRLLNATDLREFVKRAADHCMRALRKKDPAIAMQVEVSLQPMLQQFEEENSISQFVDHQLGFLMATFGKQFQGTPIVVDEITQAPFAAGDSVQMRTTFTLLSSTDEQAEVKIQKQLGDRVLQAKGTAATPKATPASEALSIKDWQQEQRVILDLKSTWPIRMTMNTRIDLSDGSNATEETAVEIR